MPVSVDSRSCARIFAVGFAFAALMTGQAPAADRMTAEPFGLATIALPEGPLTAKWHGVENDIAADLKVIAECRADRANCASPQALQFLKIVDAATAQTGLARVGEINRAFNLAIRAMSDQAQYGVEDLWTSPLATLTAGAGDCEDYAIAKIVALREAGLAAEDVRLMILRETSGDDHAVAAARIDGRWRVLDNRHMLMLEDTDVTRSRPLFAMDAEGAKRFVDPMIAMASAAPMPDAPATADRSDAGVNTSVIAADDLAIANKDTTASDVIAQDFAMLDVYLTASAM